ncbi:MAG: preprotein translocase subunit SecA [Simkaniaceae bacterium]
MFGILKKVLGTAQSRQVKKYAKAVKEINRFETSFQSLSDQEIQDKHVELKRRACEGEDLDLLLPEAYALIKNVCRRLCGEQFHVSGYDQKWDMVPYDVQLIGAIAMHYGSISEMQTGEGKTLTASLPLYLHALTGKPVHLVTVNDYLAKRDSEWTGAIFRYFGLSVGALTNNVSPHLRKELYACDILYGTASEFGFDYLRDNSMSMNHDDQCQRGHYFAIIDEVDSILIDEARTPLIISGPSGESRQMYDLLKGSVAQIVKKQRDICIKLANEAKKSLDSLGFSQTEEEVKLSKEENKIADEAFKKLWVVSKGTPKNKVLKRLKENPDVRAKIDDCETYFFADPNKEEKSAALSELFIIVDERANDYELTDKGIQAWAEASGNEESKNDFVMFDLGHEYALIDEEPSLSDQEKMQKKVDAREKDALRKERAHNLRQLFRAHLLMERDVDYIVQEDKIVIIDDNTGRPQPGRRFSDGLHQAIEAKESVSIQQETQTYATITLQNYFRMYDRLSGMTGTAITEASEFKEIYKIDVLEIPTHRPCKRQDENDEIYMTEREKYNAILKDILSVHGASRPILVGTESVEVSEKLSRILKQNHLDHVILNAKNHAHEAEIIANAGQSKAITVATNMAGRGTDIKLGEGVAKCGGLHVIGTTRHQSRRIDRQLRGRCGRQGDPGTSKFYVSFEDSLMRLFTSPRLTAFLQRFRPPEGEPISAPILNKSIETAQKRVEQRNYSMRKHTLEYDDVMNKQRQEVYSYRNELLKSTDTYSIACDALEDVCHQMSQKFFSSREDEEGWNPKGYREWLMTHFPVTFLDDEFDDDYLTIDEIEKRASNKVIEAFQTKLSHEKEMIERIQKQSKQPIDLETPLQGILTNLLIRLLDKHWQQHLLSIDHLRSEVSLRVVGQKDPLLEFKHEAFLLFDRFSNELKVDIAHALFKFGIIPPEKAAELEHNMQQIEKLKKNKTAKKIKR